MVRPKEPNDFSSLFQYDKKTNTVFLNLSGLQFMSPESVNKFEAALQEKFTALGQRVHVLVNYKGVEIAPGVQAMYATAVQSLQTKHYLSVKRFAAMHAFRNESANADQLAEFNLPGKPIVDVEEKTI